MIFESLAAILDVAALVLIPVAALLMSVVQGLRGAFFVRELERRILDAPQKLNCVALAFHNSVAVFAFQLGAKLFGALAHRPRIDWCHSTQSKVSTHEATT